MVKLLKSFFPTLTSYTLISGCSAGDRIQLEKPFYKAYFKSQGVLFGVVVNGAEVYFGDSGRPTTLEIPVNQFVRAGENKLELQLHTWERNDELALDDSAYISLEYRLYPNTVNNPQSFVVLNQRGDPD